MAPRISVGAISAPVGGGAPADGLEDRRVEHERFFTEHVPAAIERGQHGLVMQRGRRADVDEIERLSGRQRVGFGSKRVSTAQQEGSDNRTLEEGRQFEIVGDEQQRARNHARVVTEEKSAEGAEEIHRAAAGS